MTISYQISPNITDSELNELFHSVWDDHKDSEYQKVLRRSIFYVCAFDGKKLVGYANIAWDGDEHGFILDTTVHKEYQRKKIGSKLLEVAIQEAKRIDLKWLHVDFLPHLRNFYLDAGFKPTEAGLIRTGRF